MSPLAPPLVVQEYCIIISAPQAVFGYTAGMFGNKGIGPG